MNIFVPTAILNNPNGNIEIIFINDMVYWVLNKNEMKLYIYNNYNNIFDRIKLIDNVDIIKEFLICHLPEYFSNIILTEHLQNGENKEN